MSDLPSRASILEEGPREGFQSEGTNIRAADKVSLIEALAETGLTEINCASFVSDRVMPQMADAEEVAASIKRKAGVAYRGMWLNKGGYLRAHAAGLELTATICGSGSDAFLMKNNRRTRAQYLEEQDQLLDLYAANGLHEGPIYVFTAFGCNYEGEVPIAKVITTISDLMALLAARGRSPTEIYLCDTIGAADPQLVRRVVGAVRDRWPNETVALHLHDTRGLGVVCAQAGLELGIARFDASCGGLGGCPFAGNKAAAGNIATEELALLCERMGVATGIDISSLIEAARLAERIVGHPLPSKLAKVGVFKH
jgi:hydroxymethylglutaryl-CoA lyase